MWQKLYETTGILRYSPLPTMKLIVEVDPEIARYYRALVPKWIRLNPQKYATHISVVRKENVPNLQAWGKYEGEEIAFTYGNTVRNGTVYYWLDAFCTRLEEIRVELGLPVTSEYTRPPDGWSKCFHTTIGNVKEL